MPATQAIRVRRRPSRCRIIEAGVTVPLAAIISNGLTKSYGMQRGVVDLDLEVREGEVFRYLRSTFFRTLHDRSRPLGRSTLSVKM